MYNIELKHITLQNAQTEVLKATENICETFQLEEQFGVISYGMHELVSLIERTSDNQDITFTINFFIEGEKIAIQVSDCQSVGEVYHRITKSSLEDADTTAYTVGCLTDQCELRDGGNVLWLEIEVHPTYSTVNRAEVLQQQAVQKQKEI